MPVSGTSWYFLYICRVHFGGGSWAICALIFQMSHWCSIWWAMTPMTNVHIEHACILFFARWPMDLFSGPLIWCRWALNGPLVIFTKMNPELCHMTPARHFMIFLCILVICMDRVCVPHYNNMMGTKLMHAVIQIVRGSAEFRVSLVHCSLNLTAGKDSPHIGLSIEL